MKIYYVALLTYISVVATRILKQNDKALNKLDETLRRMFKDSI